jgi:hypothetical protein
MPRQYEVIRDKLALQGMDYDKAQSHAAAIYNAKHQKAPVTGKSDGKHKKPPQGWASLANLGHG